jgi:hypothetical protein
MIYTDEMPLCGIILIPNFMKICADFQSMLRFYLNNLNGCNVGITEGKDL